MKFRAIVGLATILFAATMVFTSVRGDDDKAKVELEGIKCAMNLKGGAKDVEGSSIDFKGGHIFFCCANCPKAFQAGLEDAGKKDQLTAQGNWQLAATGQAKSNGKCPLTGRDLNPEQKTSVNGLEVTFCCPNCKGAVAKQDDVQKQIQMVFADKPFEKGFKAPAAAIEE